MNWKSVASAPLSLAVLLLSLGVPVDFALATGARLYKSGPIQITADGRWVWVANEENDSVSRLDTTNDDVLEIELPAVPDDDVAQAPRGLSVTEDGSEVWVACHGSDRVCVLSHDGTVLTEVGLPWGSGPYSVALSRDQATALVTLHRAAGAAVIDVASRSVTHILEPIYWSPMGIAWTEDGDEAWITHLFAPGEHPLITRIDFSGAEPKVKTSIQIFASDPRHSSQLSAPYNVAEGGYLTTRGHPAQIPSATGRNELWLPTQYNNITEDIYTPDSTVQSTIRHLDLRTHKLPNTNQDKVILSALHVHNPQNQSYDGPGWNAGVSGPIDIGFSSDGDTTYLLHELSNDLVVMASTTPAVKPTGASPLPEIAVGDRPKGLAVSPTAEVAYVFNLLSRDVSVVDLAGLTELRRIPVTPSTGEPLPTTSLQGAKIFHSSDDPRISANGKVSCASCHINGEHDGRAWAFHRLPGRHGPREVPSLLGLRLTMGPIDPATGLGQLHRSGDRDEVQDFEHTFQSVNMGGSGFLGAAARPELGPPNSGLSPELDALEDYLLSLDPVMRSPYREADGSLSEAAIRGATFFVGANRGSKRADAGCASCHVPETGFVDFQFHDVGHRRPSSEEELNSRQPLWAVNTPTLVGVWTTPVYSGISTFAEAPDVDTVMLGFLENLAQRAGDSNGHGTPDGLTGRQLRDLAEFVLSIDGNLTAAEVRSARDTTPPRIVRVEAASLTTVDVWFSETVEESSAEDTANWSLEETGGAAVPITAATWHPRNGDRVTLKTQLRAHSEYRLAPAGAILDAADSASDGIANSIDLGDPANTHTLSIGTTLTITLGASGYENLDIKVHDSAMVGPGLSTWNHDAVWLFPVNGGPGVNTGFVRFDWRTPFVQTTEVSASEDILEASLSLHGELGEAQPLQIRRVLQPWSDPSSGGDWNRSANGAPTWRDHAHPSSRWNRSGAANVGGTGRSVSHYNSSGDVASAVDATVDMPAVNEAVTFAGDAVTDAFRFWFDNPSVDYGYAVRVLSGSTQETKFHKTESALGLHGPTMTITYDLNAPSGPSFSRGDCNGDGFLDIGDALFHLFYNFAGGSQPGCLAACDANGDGAVEGETTDAVYLLTFAFLGGPRPADPFPGCAEPTTPSDLALGCASSTDSCP